MKTPRGIALLNALFKKMVENNETKHDLAKKFGVSYSYLTALGNTRSASGLTIDVIRSMAEYLDIPTAQALMLAGVMTPEDFYLERTISDRANLVYKEMLRDPILGAFAPSPENWNELNEPTRLLIAVLYENNAKTKILDISKMIKLAE